MEVPATKPRVDSGPGLCSHTNWDSFYSDLTRTYSNLWGRVGSTCFAINSLRREHDVVLVHPLRVQQVVGLLGHGHQHLSDSDIDGLNNR